MAFAILPELIAQYSGSKKHLAEAIGLSPQAFSRLATTSPSIDLCLKLSAATGVNPQRILRSAGRHDAADALDKHFGPPTAAVKLKQQITPREYWMLVAMRHLPPMARKALYTVIEHVIDPQGRHRGAFTKVKANAA